ncbi:MAG: hypothetical protein LUE91_05390, partial [Oscillospiraceae bacterium]|nr:hypothetical protein [Oscillospiraceae bacterium]
TVSTLMEAGVDVIILGSNGYSYTGSSSSGTGKAGVLLELADLGYSADEVPLVMDSNTISVQIGSNGYNYSPITPMFVPYVQVYAYMEELEEVSDGLINPAAMVEFMFNELCHVSDDESRNVALYYIGTNWDAVDDEYDTVPDIENYVYDEDAIIEAINVGIQYALSGEAEENGNTLLAAYRTSENAYVILTEYLETEMDLENYTSSDYISLADTGDALGGGVGTIYYLNTTALYNAATTGNGSDMGSNESGGTSQFENVDTSFAQIITYYNSGEYGYGDDLQATLQNYLSHMVEHVWDPSELLSVEGTYGYESTVTSASAYADLAPSAVVEVDESILSGGTAAANTHMLSFLGINVTTTDNAGISSLAQLIFGSAWNESADPYIANYYYNTANGIDSDEWEGEYLLTNFAKSGPTGGVSDTSTSTITVNGVTKTCNTVFFYEPDVLLGSSTSSYSTGIEYYQSTVNGDYDPLQIGGWGTGTGSYAQSDGTFASTVAMANGVYYDAVAIQAWLDYTDSDLSGRYGDIVANGETYSDFALGIHFYYQLLVAEDVLDPVNYTGGLTINSDGTYTLSAGSGRMAQYADGLGTLVTGTYNSIEEVAAAVDVIVGSVSDSTVLAALETAGVKVLSSLPQAVYGTTMQSPDNIIGLPYFFAFFYEDQLADAGIDLTVADVTAYFVKNIYHVKADYVQDAVTVMMENLSESSTITVDYQSVISEMIEAGEEYYLILGDSADCTWAAVDLADATYTYTESTDATSTQSGNSYTVIASDGTVIVSEVTDSSLVSTETTVGDDVAEEYQETAQTIVDSVDIDASLAEDIETAAAEYELPDADSDEVLAALQEAVEAEDAVWAVDEDGTITIDGETATISVSYDVALSIEVTACDASNVTVAITPVITVTATASVASSSSSGGSSVTAYSAVVTEATLAVSGTYTIDIDLAGLSAYEVTVVDASGASVTAEIKSDNVVTITSGLPETFTITVTKDEDYHTYDKDSIVYTWFSDYSSCTATLTATDGTGYTKTVDCTVTYEDTIGATCTTDGATVYTATVTFGSTTYTNEKTVAIPATGHVAGEAVIENYVAATETTDGSYDAVVYCTVCGEELSRMTITIQATGSTDGSGSTSDDSTGNILMVGTASTATIASGGDQVIFSFTPSESATYVFYTREDDMDTYGCLYDASFNLLAEDDDGGSGTNFRISYTLTAGETYYLAARYYSSSSTGSFSVYVNPDSGLAANGSTTNTYYVELNASQTLTADVTVNDGVELTYQWRDSSGTIEDATSPTYTIENVTSYGYYRC